MKKIISVFILLMFISNIAFTKECNWKEVKKEDGVFIYPEECHYIIGSIVKENKLRKKQVDKLNKAIDFKDLTIDKTEERVKLWRETSYKLEDRLQKQHKWSQYNNWIYFAGGVAVAILSAWANGQAAKK